MFRWFKRNRRQRFTHVPPDTLGAPTVSGVVVDESKSLAVPAVFACVRVLAESIASLPLIVYERLGDDDRRRARDFYLYRILHDAPNPLMTSLELRETLMGHLALRGNAYCYIERSGGKVVALWPLNPVNMAVKIERGSVVFDYYRDGTIRRYQNHEILHLKGLSNDGLVGYSPLAMFREAFGSAIAVREFSAKFFSQGAAPRGVLTHSGVLQDEVLKRLRDQVDGLLGRQGVHKTPIFEEGMEFKSIGLDPEDSQMIETMKFTVVEIARIYRVPLNLIMDYDRSTYSNVTEQNRSFLTHTLTPWMARIEQGLYRALLTETERQRYFIEHLPQHFLRGDAKTRYEAYEIGRRAGFLTVNEIRKYENLNRIEGGDSLGEADSEPAAETKERSQETIPGEEDEGSQVKLVISAAKLADVVEDLSSIEKIMERHRPSLEKTFSDAVSMEVETVRKGLKEAIKVNPGLVAGDRQAYNAILKQIYQDMPEKLKRQIRHALWAYQDEIYQGSLRLVGADAGKKVTQAFERFKKGYLDNYANRHVGTSLEQLKAILEDMNIIDMAQAVDRKFDAWVTGRGEGITNHETVRAAWSTARESWRHAGVERLRWKSNPDCCPFCKKMDGKVVGIREPFLQKGDVLSAQDERKGKNWMKMKISRKTSHPPVHRGCVCQIVPMKA